MPHASSADTLSSAYSERWEGAVTNTESEYFLIELLASNDLIFVVLFVSLIIWFVFIFYLVRIDKKVDALERKYETSLPAEEAEAAEADTKSETTSRLVEQ